MAKTEKPQAETKDETTSTEAQAPKTEAKAPKVDPVKHLELVWADECEQDKHLAGKHKLHKAIKAVIAGGKKA